MGYKLTDRTKREKRKIELLEKKLSELKKKFLDRKIHDQEIRVYNMLCLIKNACEKDGFSFRKFFKENKFNKEFMGIIIDDIGLVSQLNDSCKKPKYKWIGGDVSIGDARYAISSIRAKKKKA